MAFYFLCLTVLIMFLPPVSFFPWMESLQPLRNSAILALVAYFFSRKKTLTRFYSVDTNRYFIWFIVLQTVSSASVWISGGIETFNQWIRLGIVYYLITREVTSERNVRGITLVIVLSMVYVSYYSISKFIVNYQPGMRAAGFGWYENSNDLAIMLVAVVPLALLLANTSKVFIMKVVFLGAAALFSFNILFTGSRNGLLGLVAVAILSILSATKIPGFIRSILFVSLIISVVTVGIANVLGRGDLQGLS
jgi:hypothetical protein